MNSKFSPVAGVLQEKSETKNQSRETHNHEREHEEGKGATQTIYTKGNEVTGTQLCNVILQILVSI